MRHRHSPALVVSGSMIPRKVREQHVDVPVVTVQEELLPVPVVEEASFC